MNEAAGHHEFVKASAAQLVDHFSQTTPAVKAAITAATGSTTDAQIEHSHEIQRETTCDTGCTPFDWVSGRGEDGTQTAISQYAELRFSHSYLTIVYTTSAVHPWDGSNGTPKRVGWKEYRFLRI